MSQANHDRLHDIVATLLELEPAAVTADTGRENTPSWDSLNHLNVCLTVGQEFGVELSTDEVTEVATVADLKLALTRHGVAFP